MKTLFILPNAIGDVLSGLGVAEHFAKDGEVFWIVNPSGADLVDETRFRRIVSPSDAVRARIRFGAPTEIVWSQTKEFLAGLKALGPFDRVVNPHLSRASSLMAGAVDAGEHRGPALGTKVVSDTWSDFVMGSIHCGFSPEITAAARFSLISRLPRAIPPSLTRGENHDGEIILVPFAGWATKCLDHAVAASLADRLSGIGPVTLLGAPVESERIAAIRGLMKSKAGALCPAILRDSLERIRGASLVVTVDTWAMHAASAANVPVFAILGPTRVFPRGRAAAMSPDGVASWKADGDRAIDSISAEVIAAGIESFLRNENFLPAPEIYWRCDREFPLPSRPVKVGGDPILSWSRAMAFREIVRLRRDDLPLPDFRNASDFSALIDDVSGSREKARKTACEKLDIYALFETTFPGMNPEDIQREWLRKTLEFIDSI